MSSFEGKNGEIGSMGGVVIQTTHDVKDMVNRMRVDDKSFYIYDAAVRSLEPSTVRIDINDLVFRAGTSRAPRQNLLNNAIEVTSNLNGYAVCKNKVRGAVQDPNNPTEEELHQALSESIRFIGQALGSTTPNPEREEEQKVQLTTRVQGTGHIINTGPEQLSPGDTLYWDLFTKAEVKGDDFKKRLTRYGYGAKKVPLKTVPLSAAHNSFNTAITRALADPTYKSSTAVGQFGRGVADSLLYTFWLGKGAPGGDLEKWKATMAGKKALEEMQKDKKAFDKYVTSLVRGFMYFQGDLKRREIGKVLSYAAPGKGVDVLIGAN